MRRRLRRFTTAGGRATLGVAMVSLMAGVDPFRTQLSGLFAVASSLIFVAFWASLIFRRRLVGDWSLPVRVVAGSPFKVQVRLSNASRASAYDVEAVLESVPEGLWHRVEDAGENRCDQLLYRENAVIELNLEAHLRGAYTLGPVYAGVTYPFGVFRFSSRLGGKRRLLVTPKIHPIRSLQLDPGLRYQPGGVPLASRTGESLEFVGVREYRQGDSLRKIHWKLWARRGEPVVREYSQEYFSRVGLILDTYRPPKGGEFEVAAEVAGSIASFLGHQDAIVDFFAAGSEVYFLSMGRQLGSLQSILDVLACVEPCQDSPYGKLEQQLLDVLSGLSAVVVITFQPDARRREFFERLRLGGAPLRIFCVGGRPDPGMTHIDPREVPGCLLHM